MASQTLPLKAGLLAQVVLFLSMCSGTAATTATPIVYGSRRYRPPPQRSSVSDRYGNSHQRHRDAEHDVTTRLRRLESAIAIHHTGIKRQLEAITSHLAASPDPTVSDSTVLSELTNLARMVTSLSEQVSEGWQRAEKRRRADANQIQLLQSAVRSQGRVLMGLRSQLRSSAPDVDAATISEELKRARGDIQRLENTTVEQSAVCARKISKLDDRVASSIIEETTRQNKIEAQMSNMTALVRSVEENLNVSMADIKKEIFLEKQAMMTLNENVQRIGERVSTFVNISMHSIDEISGNIDEKSSQEREALNMLLEEERDLLRIVDDNSQNRTNQIREDLLQMATVQLNHTTSLDNQLSQLSTQLSVTASDVTNSSAEVRERLARIEDLQSDADTIVQEMADSLESLTKHQSRTNFGINETLSKLADMEGVHSEVSDTVQAVLEAVAELSEKHTALNGSINAWKSSTQNATLELLSELRTEFASFSKAQSSVESAVNAVTHRLDSLAVMQNALAAAQSNVTHSTTAAAALLDSVSQQQHALLAALEGLQSALRSLERKQGVMSDADGHISAVLTQLTQSHAQLQESVDSAQFDLGRITSELRRSGHEDVNKTMQQLSSLFTEMESLEEGLNGITKALSLDKDKTQSDISTIAEKLDVLIGHVVGQLRGMRDDVILSANSTGEGLRRVEEELTGLDEEFAASAGQLAQVQITLAQTEASMRIILSEIVQQLDHLGVNANFTEIQLVNISSNLSQVEEKTSVLLSNLNERLGVIQQQILATSLQLSEVQNTVGESDSDTGAALESIQQRLSSLDNRANATSKQLQQFHNTLHSNHNATSSASQDLDRSLMTLTEQIGLVKERLEVLLNKSPAPDQGDKCHNSEEHITPPADSSATEPSATTPSTIATSAADFKPSSPSTNPYNVPTVRSESVVTDQNAPLTSPTVMTGTVTEVSSPARTTAVKIATSAPPAEMSTTVTTYVSTPVQTMSTTSLEKVTATPMPATVTTTPTPKTTKKPVNLYKAFLQSLKKKYAKNLRKIG